MAVTPRVSIVPDRSFVFPILRKHQSIKNKYKAQPVNTIDGVKIEFGNEWVHLRKSNTEPIIRIISESDVLSKAEILANKIIEDIKEIISDQGYK